MERSYSNNANFLIMKVSLTHPSLSPLNPLSLSLPCKCISLFLKYLVTVTFMGFIHFCLFLSLPSSLSLSYFIYAVMRMNDNQRFMEEFSTIPDHPKEVANLECNLIKNRYYCIIIRGLSCRL